MTMVHFNSSSQIRTVSFIQALRAEDIPGKVLQRAALTLLDTCGVAAAGSRMKAAALMKSFARRHYAHAPSAGTDSARLLFDGNTVSPGGAALAAGQAVDSMDAMTAIKMKDCIRAFWNRALCFKKYVSACQLQG